MEQIKIEQHSSIGLAWVAGWLFTIGYLEAAASGGAYGAIIVWPYYLGAHFSAAAELISAVGAGKG